MKRFRIRYVLHDGTRSSMLAQADCSVDALAIVQRLFGVRLRFASTTPAAH